MAASSRREFVRALAAAGAAGILGADRAAALVLGSGRTPLGAPAPLRILILGGTGMTGPFQVRYAIDRGHQVTVFNRGRRPAELPAGVEHLVGDRNGDLQALRGREWDVVIDNPTTLPVWVRDAASLLQGHVGHYVFISTISVYAAFDRVGMDETSALAPYTGADPMAETMESLSRDMSLYGPLKALSEQEAERWFPGRTTVIRPGLIVGPRDETDRFTYWPVRVARGGEILAPGTPADPVQFIDGRDLAEWTIRMAEDRVAGVFNATGPVPALTIGAMLEAMRPLASVPPRFLWAPTEFLDAQGILPWTDMPSWAPPVDGMVGFARVDVRRALAAGLVFRPFAETAGDTLAWFRTLPPQRQAQLRAGLDPEREAAALAALRSR